MKEAPKPSSEKNISMAVVAYILFFVPLLVEDAKKDKFVQYHLVQSIGLVIVAVINMMIGMIQIIGWIIAPLVSVGIFILCIMGIINAANGKEKPLPLIGEIAIKNLKIFK